MKIRKFFSSLYKCSLKVFALILALFFALGVPALTRTAAAPAVSMRTVKPTEPIEHLFTHCLIAHPEIAFAKNNEYGRHLDRDCLTLGVSPHSAIPVRRRLRADGYPRHLSGKRCLRRADPLRLSRRQKAFAPFLRRRRICF